MASESAGRMPLVVLVVGMAGTGKTTLVQRINHFAIENDKRAYFINMDPAVVDVPFDARIDIRDAVDYKDVMTKHRLGPNGAILTSLNVYATHISQVIGLVEARKDEVDYVFVDTPGQIEVFTWSASGQIITEAFASTFPTTMLFVGDTTRCVNPQTFMSTMLYSSSIMYKSQLPLTIAFNKCDAADGATPVQWMRDPEALSLALRDQKSYVATLTDSLAVFLHEFYETLQFALVSALAGTGIEELFEGLDRAKQQYVTEFLPVIRERAAARESEAAAAAADQVRRLQQDMADGDDGGAGSPS
uniref:GPN-loop GTPase n=1 Tax=Neobodo designis TaxID=312471 RepID=A0A7S1L8X8_NEODS